MNAGISEKKKTITRPDIILIFVLLAAGAGFLFWQMQKKAGTVVKIYSDNELIAEMPLNRDDTLTVANELGTNTIIIENGRAYMTDADCPDKICEQMGKISRTGEMIVCLPHKLIAEISDEH